MSAPRYLEQVVLGEERGFLSWLIRALMLPFSLIYRTGLAIFLGIYSMGLRKRYRLGVPVISVGNITFGGTGKTPAVQTICRMLIDQGKKVVILSRGHGGSLKGSMIVSDGCNILTDSSEAGDEPMLLASTLPGVPVVVGKDRRDSGRLACREFDPDVILLDDGLQYWQLHRDLDIAVLDASKPFGSGFVMPMGDLRESVSGLRRAEVVLLTNTTGIDEARYAKIVESVSKLTSHSNIYRSAHKPLCFKNADNGETIALDWIRGRKIVAFCGIGKPSAFIDMLESLGASVARSIVFPDHYRYTVEDITRITGEYKQCGVEAIVTTEKDIARLDKSNTIPDLIALSIELEIYERQKFTEHVSSRINSENK